MKTGAPVGRNELTCYSAVGERVRKIRHDLGWSQDRLGEEMGCLPGARSHISRIEHGKMNPGVEWVARFCEAVGIQDLGEFFSGIRASEVAL